MDPNHPGTAGSLNNLATVLSDQGDLDTARTLLERALAILNTHLGSDHPLSLQGVLSVYSLSPEPLIPAA